jgi:hypothetical protein
MPWTFNPFSGTFDQKGSGGGGGASYIDGEVQNFSALPTANPPAVDSAYLVREPEGTWLINRKPAGIYIRVATTGTRATDWTYAGILPDVFNDANFLLYDNGDSSKNLAFQLSGITTGTTRTLTAPDASGRIQLEGQAIGNTTPAAGTFTTLAANNGTLTASAPVLDLAQTWNASGTTFTGLNLALTNTASASASAYLSLALDGTQAFSIRRGETNANATIITCGGAGGLTWTARTRTGAGVGVNFSGVVGVGSSLQFGTGTSTTAGDITISREAANILAQSNGTNAQTFNIYNTFTSSTNHERGFLRWSSNVFQIGTEKGSGGGTARTLELQVDGTTFLGASTGGTVRFGSQTTQSTTLIGWVGNCYMRPVNAAAGVLTLLNNALDGFNRLQFGGVTSSFPALKRDSTTLQVRLADDSAFAPLACGALTLNGNLDASTRDIVTDTTTGTKIGTATTQKIGFFNATPAVQPAAVADATDAASTQDRLNDLLARLRTLGLIAT